MKELKIFLPTVHLTDGITHLAPELCDKMFDYINAGAIVTVVNPPGSVVNGFVRNVAEVLFPWRKQTDLVSPDFLHGIDSPLIKNYLSTLKKRRKELKDADSD